MIDSWVFLTRNHSDSVFEPFLILVRNIDLLAMNAVANIGFVLQNVIYLPYRPRIGFFLSSIFIDVCNF